MKKVIPIVLFIFLINGVATVGAQSWECEILPAEQKIVQDAKSGAELIYVTTNKAKDNNLYFHDRCWLLYGRMMLFYSDRSGRNELYGYLAGDGQLVKLNRNSDGPAHSAVASREGDKIYVVRDKGIFEWRIELREQTEPKVTVTERKIGAYPQNSIQSSGLNENCDATLVCFGYEIDKKPFIAVADIKSGKTRVVAEPPVLSGHLQFSWNRPDLLSFNGRYGSDTAPLDPNEPPHCRIWYVNINIGTPLPAFYQKPGELATHECWWVNDQMTFIGGHRPEEAHVKVIDLKSGNIRVIGAGAWWEGADDKEISKVNWWHSAGSPDGKWVVADNWHGIIALFNAKTTEMHILTDGHRTYGGGAHPHVGWDLYGKSVEFTTNKFGNADVVIATIPDKW